MIRRSHLLRAASLNALALVIATVAQAQQSLPTIDVGGARSPVRAAPVRTAAPSTAPARVSTPAPVRIVAPATGVSSAPGFSAEKLKLPVYRQPTGQTFTTVDTQLHKNTPLFNAADLLIYSPGTSFKAGNGPRDVGISIRGSGARNGFGIRNIFLLEDGFPVTQPDGLGRADLIDPHAYSGVDVYRGPSSALFGNYANGGAINFRTRTGAEIDGVWYGNEFGSFGYVNNYLIAGKHVGDFDVSVFASDVRSDGFAQHTQFDTQTVNAKATWSPTPDDRITLKFIHNQMYNNLSGRLSLNQFYLNPFQRGCVIVAPPFAPYCATANVPRNGFAGANIAVTADQAGFHRDDRRDIIGLRWEHDFDKDTTWRTQVVYDDKNIDQPTGAQKGTNDVPSIQASSDITKVGEFMGLPARHWVGLFFGKETSFSITQNTLPFGNGAGGAVIQHRQGQTTNISLRGREEIALSPDVTAVLGLSTEYSRLDARSSQYNYNTFRQNGVPARSVGIVPVSRIWWNFGPEASVTWRARPDLQLYARASSGYGIPNAGQLFIAPNGFPGNNTELKPQRNTGFDAGFTWTPDPSLRVVLNGFHEWYQNELINQAAGVGLQAFTFNAPGSVHRGAEFLTQWKPIEGPWNGYSVLFNYSYNNQIFTNFTETLAPGAGAQGAKFFFGRAGNKIPGVAPHEFTLRAGYDQPYGPLQGLGAFVEYNYKHSYFIDNGNHLTIPSFGVVNVNLHYDRDLAGYPFKNISAFVEVRNVFDRTYIASANNINNTVSAAGFETPGVLLATNGLGSIYAGMPRAIQGGVRFKF